ncbi:hypothetical protein AVEN_86604-1 [Araneus ventricosus]|uniref:Uncharacterized protein n=1 Tax=Araneus ventricosus TaxID=182803 RepID=A0A4Y2J8X2_ARAVE|nr:hypothetical protein AVEN_86604-1 [Araneus ventricosus]
MTGSCLLKQSHVHLTGTGAVMVSGAGTWGGVLSSQTATDVKGVGLLHPRGYFVSRSLSYGRQIHATQMPYHTTNIQVAAPAPRLKEERVKHTQFRGRRGEDTVEYGCVGDPEETPGYSCSDYQ